MGWILVNKNIQFIRSYCSSGSIFVKKCKFYLHKINWLDIFMFDG